MQGRICAWSGAWGKAAGWTGALVAAITLALGGWATSPAHAETLTFGKTTVGASKQVLSANRKRVNHYSLPTAGTLSQLSIYLEPTSVAGSQVMEGVIYADAGGLPGALLAATRTITYSSTEPAGWYALSFAAPFELAAGTYWIGVLSGVTSRVAGYRYDGVAGARAFNRDVFTTGASNPFGEVFTDSQQMSLYATYTPAGGAAVPVNSAPPTVSGTVQQGQTLTEAHGTWTNSPTSFAYQWLQCNSLGASCLPISGATAQTYVPVAGDVGHTLAVQEVASNSAGAGSPALSAPTKLVVPPAPVNTAPPTISGTPQQGQTLSEAHGTWTNEPTGFAYQWQQCDGSGNSCRAIAGSTAQTYVLGLADVGHTIRVQETARNAGGSGAPASSAATAAVAASGNTATFGKTTVGASRDGGLFANYKIVHSAALSVAGSVTKLTVYAVPGVHSPKAETLKAVIYADSTGAPGALVATGSEVVYQGSVNGSGWLDLPFSSPVALQPGTYWIGFITGGETEGMGYVYDKVANNRSYSANAFASGPSNPFGTATKDSEQASIYATYFPSSLPPENTAVPTISGTAQTGHVLSASTGTWTDSPASFGYSWQRCNSAGASCAPIAGANAATYTLVEADLGSTLRVAVTATNQAGTSAPATSAQTEVVTAPMQPPTNTAPPAVSGTPQVGQLLSASPGTWTGSPTSFVYQWQRCEAPAANCSSITGATQNSYTAAEADTGKTLRVLVTASNESGPSAPAASAATGIVTTSSVSHLEYVLENGTTSVYDMDHEFKLVKTILLPQTKAEVRGVTVAPATHLMFIPVGGDGGGNGNGSVLAYDLVQEKMLWESKLSTGIDSGQVSPDGSKLYMPTGELTSSGIWNVLSTTNGAVIGTIQGGAGPHNTVVSNDGRFVYLGGRAYNFLDVYEVETGKVKEIGPLVGTVRPLTVNGSNTLAFTTATGFDGFQVSSITTGKVLFTVSFGEVPKEFEFTGPSHGISMSPDEKQVYVVDAVHKEVQFWDVSKVKEGVAPTQIGVVPVAGLAGKETSCNYDCGRGGWLQLSRDGRFLFVGDSGEVIETATRKVITTLPTLANTKKSIEVDWQNGAPVATSGRTGVGQVP